VYEVRTISNDERRDRSCWFKRPRKRRDRRSVEQRATEAALAELLKGRAYLKPIDLLLVTERIRSALEFVTGIDRLRLDREERGPSGMGLPPAPAEPSPSDGYGAEPH
jgi:hypothetical protein